MILPKGPHLGKMAAYVGRPLLLLFIWDVLVVLAYKLLHWDWLDAKSLPLALYGSAIGIIVGFRNNSAFARWWEGRILWGQIVNNSRSLARQVLETMRPARGDSDELRQLGEMQRGLLYYQIAFVHALRQQLRGLSSVEELTPLLSAQDLEAVQQERNVPAAIQRRMARMLRQAKDRQWIDGLEWQSLDRNLDDLLDAQGGVERIKNTPIPKQYDYFPMVFVQIYCILLPAGMVGQLGWLTPLGSTLVGFIFLALDKTGRDLESPFDNTIHDVPITSISKTIEANLRQALGERDVPQAVQAVRGVLW